MTNRLKFIRPDVKARPQIVASNLRKIAAVLDSADEHRECAFYAGYMTGEAVRSTAIAWSQTALLIADMADVDSVTLRAMAATIDKGEQHVLPGL